MQNKQDSKSISNPSKNNTPNSSENSNNDWDLFDLDNLDNLNDLDDLDDFDEWINDNLKKENNNDRSFFCLDSNEVFKFNQTKITSNPIPDNSIDDCPVNQSFTQVNESNDNNSNFINYTTQHENRDVPYELKSSTSTDNNENWSQPKKQTLKRKNESTCNVTTKSTNKKGSIKQLMNSVDQTNLIFQSTIISNDNKSFANKIKEQQPQKIPRMNILFKMVEDFHITLKLTAKKWEFCETGFKKLCRKIGIERWPGRKLGSYNLKISTLEKEIKKTEDQDAIENLREKKYSLEVDKSDFITTLIKKALEYIQNSEISKIKPKKTKEGSAPSLIKKNPNQFFNNTINNNALPNKPNVKNNKPMENKRVKSNRDNTFESNLVGPNYSIKKNNNGFFNKKDGNNRVIISSNALTK